MLVSHFVEKGKFFETQKHKKICFYDQINSFTIGIGKREKKNVKLFSQIGIFCLGKIKFKGKRKMKKKIFVLKTEEFY